MQVFLEETDDGIHVLRADGGINGQNASQLIDDVLAAVESGAVRIIVDCQDLEIISSSGLSTLLTLHNRIRTRGGDVKVAGIRHAVAQVLRLTRLDVVLEVYPDVHRAKLAFRG